MIEITDLRKTFSGQDGKAVAALDGLCLNIRKGELMLLMGPNGSGKTTLLRILDGQLLPDAGRIVWGNSAASLPYSRLKVSVAHVPQDPSALAFPEMTLAEHLLWEELNRRMPRFWRRGITARRLEKYRMLLESYGVPALAEALPRPLNTLSAGWRQIFLVLVSAMRSELSRDRDAFLDLLLLDEPTSALDADNSRLCLELIKRLHGEGRTIVLATHDPEIALFLRARICILRSGRLAADIPATELREDTLSRIRAVIAGLEGSP
jgi:ABC-type multidrug transport system ATPase subunit